MSDRNIVTQVGIEDLKFALSEVAENLDAHVNASLSKAHGINMTAGYIDEHGNDLTHYRDSNGDWIANYFLRFTIDNVVYYAPANFTTLEGQDESTGSVDTSPDTEADPEGGSAWITDYTSDQVSQAEAINSDVLIPHTRNPHWSTHGSLTVVLQDTFTTAGHKVGTHVIQIKIGGNVYNIPAVTRVGGPVQLPRGVSILASYYDSYKHPRDVNLSVPTNTTGGTLPFTYQWQIFSNAGWVDITPNTVQQSVSDGEKSVNILWASEESGTLLVVESNPGQGNTHTFFFRVTVTNAAGSVTSNNFQYTVKNKQTCCFIFLEALNGKLPWYIEQARDDYYTPPRQDGYKWMARWLVPWMQRSTWVRSSVNFVLIKPFLNYGAWLYRDSKSKAPYALYAPYCKSWLALWGAIGRVMAALNRLR